MSVLSNSGTSRVAERAQIDKDCMRYVKSFDDFVKFLSLVIVCAPEKFRHLDFLRDDEQINMDRAFVELTYGLEFLGARSFGSNVVDQASSIVRNSLDAYRNGDAIGGAHLLQDLEELLGIYPA
jgi:hypothetical protein